jgi:hypothetical protein
MVLQKTGLVPNELKEPYCNLRLCDIFTAEYILKHNCLKRCDGLPCKDLIWLDYNGCRWLDAGILKLLGWVKQYQKLRLQSENALNCNGLKQNILIMGESKRK